MTRYRIVREYRNADGILTGCNSIGLDRRVYARKEEAQRFCNELNKHNTNKGECFVVVEIV